MNFQNYYNSLNKEVFKVFSLKEGCYVYDKDIDKLVQSGVNIPNIFINSDNMRTIKLTKPEYESIVKTVLLEIKMCVLEYTAVNNKYEIIKEGRPSDWKDYYDLCLGDSMIPSFASIVLIQKRKINLVILSNNNYKKTTFFDDDIFSHLFCILTGFNVTEVVINDLSLEKVLKSIGMVVNYCKFKQRTASIKEERFYSLPLLSESSSFYDDQLLKNEEEEPAVLLIKKYLCIDKVLVEEMKNSFAYTIDNFTLSAINPFKYFDCYTSQGKRLLEQFIKTPLLIKEEIIKRQEITKRFINLELKELKKVTDLIKNIKQIENKKCQIINFLKIEDTLNKINEISLKIIQVNEIGNEFLELLKIIEPFKNEINRLINKEGFINQITDNLKELHLRIKKIKEEQKKEVENILKKNKKIKLYENNFKLSRIDFNIFEEEFKANKFVEINFLKSGVVFTTKEMNRINNCLIEIEELIRNEEKIILLELNEFGNNFLGILESLNYLIAYVDVIRAFSDKISEEWNFPILKENIFIEEAFHPQIKIGCVKNSIEIKEKRFVNITGPNMGGKSTFLKMMGMIGLLTQIGAPVPALMAEIPLFDSILVRIGANDCPSRHKSTFLNEMEEVAKITLRCTNNSLILIDELGRGTSDIDGLSLAKAVKDYLIEKRSFVFFATHFSEICDEKCLNKKIEVVNDKIFYKILDGVGDSYGIGVAKMVGFPEEVIKEAMKYLN